MISRDPLFLHKNCVNAQHPAAAFEPCHLHILSPSLQRGALSECSQRRASPDIPVYLEKIALLVWKADFALFVKARFLKIVRQSVAVSYVVDSSMFLNLLLVVHAWLEHHPLCSVIC